MAFSNSKSAEDATQHAYQVALEELPEKSNLRRFIARQKAALRKSHDLMKQLRDLQ